MGKWLAFDRLEGEYEFTDTEEEAKAEAKGMLKYYTDEASDEGWPEDIEGAIGYAEIKVITKSTLIEKKSDYAGEDWPWNPDHDEIWEVKLVKVEDK